MLGSASPRNPSVAIRSRSSARRILLVAWRSIASRASSGSMPSPSSSTRMSFLPPSSTVTAIRRAPASIEFSTSSLMTEAGRSTTSPAAIWLARSTGSWWILPIRSNPALAVEQREHHGADRQHDPGEPPELRLVASWKMRQGHVDPPHAGQHRQRQEDRGHDGEHLHHLVEAI